MSKRRYTPEEIKYIKVHYPHMTLAELAKQLDRPRSALGYKLSVMGIHKRSSIPTEKKRVIATKPASENEHRLLKFPRDWLFENVGR